MRPTDLQSIGADLAIKWENGDESFIPLEKLRRHCPCAGCRGEMDILGNLYKNPKQKLTAAAFQLVRIIERWRLCHPAGLGETDMPPEFFPSIICGNSPGRINHKKSGALFWSAPQGHLQVRQFITAWPAGSRFSVRDRCSRDRPSYAVGCCPRYCSDSRSAVFAAVEH